MHDLSFQFRVKLFLKTFKSFLFAGSRNIDFDQMDSSNLKKYLDQNMETSLIGTHDPLLLFYDKQTSLFPQMRRK